MQNNSWRFMWGLAATMIWAVPSEIPAQGVAQLWTPPETSYFASDSVPQLLPPTTPPYTSVQPEDGIILTGFVTPMPVEDAAYGSDHVGEERVQEIVDEYMKEFKDKELGPYKGLKGVKIGMTGYLDYSYGDAPEFNYEDTGYNEFKLTRGYLTVKKEITPWFHARVTPDAHQDSTGDWKVRLKYYYAELRPGDFGYLTDMRSEVGLGHIPWLDFEEHINPYRCQGTMPIERAGVFNSADLGVSLRGNLGGKVACAEQRIGSDHYDGRYGTWHVGVYNGSGYHATEENNNKAVEGRLTVRPLPEALPGLQLSYFGIHGEGEFRVCCRVAGLRRQHGDAQLPEPVADLRRAILHDQGQRVRIVGGRSRQCPRY